MTTLNIPSILTVSLARDAGSIELETDKLHESILLQALAHGLKQKFGDGANSEDALKNYKGATIAAKVIDKAETLRDQLYRGVWALKSGGGGPKLDDKARFMRQEAIKAAKAYIQSGKYIVNGKAITKVSDSDAVKAVSDKYLASKAWYDRVEARYVPTVPDTDMDPFAEDEAA